MDNSNYSFKEIIFDFLHKLNKFFYKFRKILNYIVDSKKANLFSFLYNVAIVLIAIFSVIPFFLIPGTGLHTR